MADVGAKEMINSYSDLSFTNKDWTLTMLNRTRAKITLTRPETIIQTSDH